MRVLFPLGGIMAFGDVARGFFDGLRAAVRNRDEAAATARFGVRATSLALSLIMLLGLVSPASAQSDIAAPTVSSVEPKVGPTAGGAPVSISGSGFLLAQPTGAVKIGATNATYTIQSDTRIWATTPANAAGTYDITVTTPSGTSATSSADQYTYVAPPTVSSISPAAGPTTAGTKVTIIGTNFTHAWGVTFGEKSALGYAVNSDTQITATAPAGTGTANIRVTTAGGPSAWSIGGFYTYIPAPTVTWVSPAEGPTTGGETVQITGTNFTDVKGCRLAEQRRPAIRSADRRSGRRLRPVPGRWTFA